MKSSHCVLLAVALTGLGCSSREVPSSFPPGSPASLSATEAPHAAVARSLREDPPLPGASTEGWPGLAADRPAAPATQDHGQSGAHEHRATPDQTSAAFSCPMHPEVTSDEPGTCPKCGMKLEPNKP